MPITTTSRIRFVFIEIFWSLAFRLSTGVCFIRLPRSETMRLMKSLRGTNFRDNRWKETTGSGPIMTQSCYWRVVFPSLRMGCGLITWQCSLQDHRSRRPNRSLTWTIVVDTTRNQRWQIALTVIQLISVGIHSQRKPRLGVFTISFIVSGYSSSPTCNDLVEGVEKMSRRII